MNPPHTAHFSGKVPSTSTKACGSSGLTSLVLFSSLIKHPLQLRNSVLKKEKAKIAFSVERMTIDPHRRAVNPASYAH